MARASISKNGIEVAKSGYDVDTAPLSKMILSPLFTTMRIDHSGIVTVAPYSNDGEWPQIYDRAIITFPRPYNDPPVVFVAGQNSNGTVDQTPFHFRFESDGGGFRWVPHYSIETFTNRFELYVLKGGGAFGTITRTWKYFVFANTLSNTTL